MPEIISDPASLDARWLTEVLRQAGALGQGRVAGVDGRAIGTGKMSDNVRLTLRYDGAPPDAPATLVVKLPASDPTSRFNASATGSYWREVSFYRELAGTLPIATPRVYFADIDDAHAEFVIVMEDMAPAQPGDQIQGCDFACAEIAMHEAAKLHAACWNDAGSTGREWLSQPSMDGAMLGQQLLQQSWPAFLERFEHVIDTDAIALGERFTRSFAHWATGYSGARTVVHADYRLENMLFGDADGDRPVTVVDWQTVQSSCGLADIAYFLGGGLLLEDRRRCERELVEIYRRGLSTRGVDLAEDECWNCYRRFSLHGLFITVLGAIITGQDERGDRMFTAMIQRHLQHALDLEASEFLTD